MNNLIQTLEAIKLSLQSSLVNKSEKPLCQSLKLVQELLDSNQFKENQFTCELEDNGLNREQIVIVLDTLDDVCHRCFDGPSDCNCSRDD